MRLHLSQCPKKHALQPLFRSFGSSYNRRKLQELPFVTHSVTGSIKKEYLLDLDWVYDKVCGADVFQVSW